MHRLTFTYHILFCINRAHSIVCHTNRRASPFFFFNHTEGMTSRKNKAN